MRLYDVGVAGLHRQSLAHMDEIMSASVIIAIAAGMEGAQPVSLEAWQTARSLRFADKHRIRGILWRRIRTVIHAELRAARSFGGEY